MKLNYFITLFALTAGITVGAESLPSMHPVAHPENRIGLQELQGRVEWVDLVNQHLQVRDTQGQMVLLRIDPASRILDERNHTLTLSRLEHNDRVVVYYDRADGTARQVDRQPSVADVLLGQ